MNTFKRFIDETDIRTLRGYVNSRQSEFKMIIFVDSSELLAPTAELLADGSPRNQDEFKRQLKTGRVCVSRNDLPKESDQVIRTTDGLVVNLNRIPENTACQVIALPPVFVVHADGLNLRPDRERGGPERQVHDGKGPCRTDEVRGTSSKDVEIPLKPNAERGLYR